MGKTIGRVVGPLGVLFVVFGLLSRVFVTGEFNWLVLGQIGLGLAGVALYAATAFDEVRGLATGRGAVFVITSAVSTVALLALLGVANYWIASKRVEWDLTEGKIHTLAQQTRDLLGALDESNKVTVTAFYRPADPEYGYLSELLRRYKNEGGEHFEYEFVDVFKNQARARAMNISQTSPRIVFKSASGREARVKEISEEALTNGLAELGRGVERRLYFLTGHGEKGIGRGAETGQGLKLWTEGLKNEGYATEELSLLARKDVPEDALAVVIAGPQVPLAPGEVEALRTYAESGGRIIAMLDPGFETGLEPMLSGWGVDLLPGVIIDPESQEPLWAFSQEFSEHPIATPRMSLFGALAFVFPDARGVVSHGAPPEGYTIDELFKTGHSAWSENDPIDTTGQTPVSRDPTDDLGPIALGVAVSRTLEDGKEFRAVVFGDSDFASNTFIRQGGNRDLALNTVQWLGGQEEKITIRPKMREKSTLAMLTKNQKMALSFFSLNLLPLALIAAGLGVWSVRRSR